MRVSPTRTVGEFLGADKRIEADIEVFIRAHPVGETRYLPERICEVDVTLPLANLTGELKSLANAYEVAAFPAAMFNEVSLNAVGPALEVTGVAVPGPAARTEEPAAVVVALWTRTAEAELPEAAADAQQGRLLAARAALAAVREELREEIFRMPLGGGTVGTAVERHRYISGESARGEGAELEGQPRGGHGGDHAGADTGSAGLLSAETWVGAAEVVTIQLSRS
jgi:hypothetical protein